MNLVSVIVLDCPSLDGLPPRGHHGCKQVKTEWIYVTPTSRGRTQATSVRSNVWHVEVPAFLDYGQDRVIGASFANGDGLIFVKYSSVLNWDYVCPFANGIRRGSGLVLHQFVEIGFPDPALRTVPAKVGEEAAYVAHRLAARALNKLLGREDLGFATADEFPHAVSRTFLNQVGLGRLESPPQLSVYAVVEGFAIETVAVPVPNVKSSESTRTDFLRHYQEAVHELVLRRGRRAGFTDLGRRRDLASLAHVSKEEWDRALT